VQVLLHHLLDRFRERLGLGGAQLQVRLALKDREVPAVGVQRDVVDLVADLPTHADDHARDQRLE
jgi:hypothetical protein